VRQSPEAAVVLRSS